MGLGAGVVDRCKELGLPVRGINVGEAASSRDNCMRLRDELWFKGREWFSRQGVQHSKGRWLNRRADGTYLHILIHWQDGGGEQGLGTRLLNLRWSNLRRSRAG